MVDQHDALLQVGPHHFRDERHEREGDRQDQQREPEALRPGDLAEFADGDEERVAVHFTSSAPPTIWTKTSCRLARCCSKRRSAKPSLVQCSSRSPALRPGSSLTSQSCQPSLAVPCAVAPTTPGNLSGAVRDVIVSRSGMVARASSCVPSKRFTPCASRSRRSQSRSACCMTWVEKITVAPPRAAPIISSSSNPWLSGSSP